MVKIFRTVAQGRVDEGRDFLVKYHGNGAENDELVAFEVSEIQEALAMEKEAKQDSWKAILSTRSSLHRLGCVLLIVIMQNLSGTAIIQYCECRVYAGFSLAYDWMQTIRIVRYPFTTNIH